MPVTTRNQKVIQSIASDLKTMKKENKKAEIPNVSKSHTQNSSFGQNLKSPNELRFVRIIKKLFHDSKETNDTKTKVEITIAIYKEFNRTFPDIFSNLRDEKRILLWLRFVAVALLKITEFNNLIKSGNLKNITSEKIDEIVYEFSVARNYILGIMYDYNYLVEQNLHDNYFALAKAEITRFESLKPRRNPRRNIKQVDYTGMDTIEPYDEFDGITDIWYDESISYDPDYEPSEDEEDEDDVEEDEDDVEEDKTKWTKVRPKLDIKLKTEKKQDTTQLLVNQRAKRNLSRVNYAGMDMNDDDKGSLYISKRGFENGKVKYIWNSYSLSKANEIGDEDYVDEE